MQRFHTDAFMIPENHVMILQEELLNGAYFYEHQFVPERLPLTPGDQLSAVSCTTQATLSTPPDPPFSTLAPSPSGQTTLLLSSATPSITPSGLGLANSLKSGDLRKWFPKATTATRAAMEQRMRQEWQTTVEERREADEEERARRKRQKTAAATERKRNQRRREVVAGIATGLRGENGKLIKKVSFRVAFHRYCSYLLCSCLNSLPTPLPHPLRKPLPLLRHLVHVVNLRSTFVRTEVKLADPAPMHMSRLSSRIGCLLFCG